MILFSKFCLRFWEKLAQSENFLNKLKNLMKIQDKSEKIWQNTRIFPELCSKIAEFWANSPLRNWLLHFLVSVLPALNIFNNGLFTFIFRWYIAIHYIWKTINNSLSDYFFGHWVCYILYSFIIHYIFIIIYLRKQNIKKKLMKIQDKSEKIWQNTRIFPEL